MKIARNIGKSTLLSMSIFWIIILSDDFDFDYVPYIFLSIFPIYFSCALVIIFTICPFFWLLKSNEHNKQYVFKTYYPIYAIMAFSLCVFCIYNSPKEFFVISFFVSAFITTGLSWVWFAKENNT